MPLTDAALTTVTTVSAAIDGSPTQATVERLINSVSDAMARVANRKFYYESDIEEDLRGEGSFRLVVKRPPIVTLTSIELLDTDGTTVYTYPTTDYAIEDAERGWIWVEGGVGSTGQYVVGLTGMLLPGSERKAIRVTYTGGWVTPDQETGALTRTLPYDLEDACVAGVVSIYRNQSRDRQLAAASDAGTSKTWYQAPRSYLPPDVVQVAKAYWRP